MSSFIFCFNNDNIYSYHLLVVLEMLTVNIKKIALKIHIKKKILKLNEEPVIYLYTNIRFRKEALLNQTGRYACWHR